MTTAAVMRDPELRAEERAELLYGGKQRRVFVSPAARVRHVDGPAIPAERVLGIWEALELGYWECRGCGRHVTGADQPAICEPCQEARASWSWVWHEPEVKG